EVWLPERQIGRLRRLARRAAVGKLNVMVRASSDQHGSAGSGRTGGVEQALEELAVAFDPDPFPAPFDKEPVERLHSAFDEHVRILDRAASRLGVNEPGDFGAEPKLEGTGRGNWREDRVERAVQPAGSKVVFFGRRVDRAQPP